MSSSPRPRRRTGWRGLLEEARRREVHRALALYGAVAWASITAAPDLIQWLAAPPWVFTALLVALGLGLPAVLVASWTLDFSVVGDGPDPSADGEGPEEFLTPADVERLGPGLGRKILRWGTPLVLLLGFPFLVRWAIQAEASGELTVAIRAPVEATSNLAPPFAWFLGARTVSVEAEDGSVGRGLRAARSVGARYLVMAESVVGGSLSATLYDADSGERLQVLPGGGADEGTGQAASRLALEMVRSIARREGRVLPVEEAVTLETSSPLALLHFMEGRRHFGAAAFDAAVPAFRRSVEADSGFVPAYYRLAVTRQWLWTYDAGWDVLGRAAARGSSSPRWDRLLEAGRRYLERDAGGALAGYEEVTLHHPELKEGWLGLGETLFHYGGVLGQHPRDARDALERALEGDSLFAPVGHHLVELALWRDDTLAARRALTWMAPGHPVRPVLEVASDLQLGTESERAAAWARARRWDLRRLSLLASHFAFDPHRRPLADSVARILMEPGRRLDERLRGAQYRLMLATDSSGWLDAVADWRRVRGAHPFDPWVVHAHQMGLRLPEAEAMLDWAEEARLAGTIPDFGLPLNDELRGAFNALVHEAVLRGDSARVATLLGSLDATEPGHPTDPGQPVLSAALRARLALLAADTTRAVEELAAATSRTFEPFVTFYPANTMAPERALLVRLDEALGRRHQADRWRSSFFHALSFGDLLYTSWVDAVSTGSPSPAPREEP